MSDTTLEPPVQTTTAAMPATPIATEGPRTRWGAIVWGLVFATVAAGALWLVAQPSRRDEFIDGILNTSSGQFWAIGLLVLGGILVVSALIGVIRRLQSSASRRR